ncbi:MAG: NAD(P)/FAD-dependent oxidoreductase [Desulfovibrio sp.]|nr:NAD(P)/FAD-dependent oxidoreductase [Desulfovibrio sp.]
MDFDAAIIGCGPGGLEAAKILAKAGKRIAVIEAGNAGGTCLNRGCVPTKMYLAAVAPINAFARLSRQKELNGELKVNFAGLRKRVARYTGASSRAVVAELENLGVKLIHGQGKISAPGRLQAIDREDNESSLTYASLIIASGSVPAIPPALAADHKVALTSDDLLNLDYIPESLLVIGSGAIGLEFASFFASCGVKITIVEAAPRLAPTEDEDISEELRKALVKRGYQIFLSATAKSLRSDGDMAVLELADGTRLEAEKALVAVGRRGTGEEVNAVAAGCRVDARGFIKVDENLRSGENVFAIGDCNGKTLLAHAAATQGRYAALRILGRIDAAYEAGPIPSCVYGNPEIMRAGLTAREGEQVGTAEASIFQLAANPIAQAHADPGGFVKAVWLNGRLAGIAAIGGGVSTMVTAAEAFVAGNYTPEKLDRFMIAHPSLDESLAAAIRAERHRVGRS